MLVWIIFYDYFCYFNLWVSICGKYFHLNSEQVLHETSWLLMQNLHISWLPAERMVNRNGIRYSSVYTCGKRKAGGCEVCVRTITLSL